MHPPEELFERPRAFVSTARHTSQWHSSFKTKLWEEEEAGAKFPRNNVYGMQRRGEQKNREQSKQVGLLDRVETRGDGRNKVSKQSTNIAILWSLLIRVRKRNEKLATRDKFPRISSRYFMRKVLMERRKNRNVPDENEKKGVMRKGWYFLVSIYFILPGFPLFASLNELDRSDLERNGTCAVKPIDSHCWVANREVTVIVVPGRHMKRPVQNECVYPKW